MGELVFEISDRATVLVREEIELAKTEVTEKLNKLLQGGVTAIVAGVFLLAALAMIMHGVAWLINDLFFDNFYAGFFIEAAAVPADRRRLGAVRLPRLPEGLPADARHGDRGGQGDQGELRQRGGGLMESSTGTDDTASPATAATRRLPPARARPSRSATTSSPSAPSCRARSTRSGTAGSRRPTSAPRSASTRASCWSAPPWSASWSAARSRCAAAASAATPGRARSASSRRCRAARGRRGLRPPAPSRTAPTGSQLEDRPAGLDQALGRVRRLDVVDDPGVAAVLVALAGVADQALDRPGAGPHALDRGHLLLEGEDRLDLQGGPDPGAGGRRCARRGAGTRACRPRTTASGSPATPPPWPAISVGRGAPLGGVRGGQDHQRHPARGGPRSRPAGSARRPCPRRSGGRAPAPPSRRCPRSRRRCGSRRCRGPRRAAARRRR